MSLPRRFLLVVLPLLLSVSCVRDITMDALEEPTVVVACVLSDEPVQTLRLSYTKGASLEAAPDLPEATAVLTDLTEGKEAGRFTRAADGSWQLAYAAIPEHRYRLDVTVPGHDPAWAEQTMPEAPGVDVRWDWWRENLPEDAKYRMVHGYIFSAGTLRSPVWFYGINYPDADSAGEMTECLYTDFPDVDTFNEIPASYWSGDESLTWDCWFRTSAYPDLEGAPKHRQYLRFPVREAEPAEFLVSGDFRNYMADPKDFVHSGKRFSELHYFSASEDYDRYLTDSYLLGQAGSSTDLSEIFLRENVYSNIQGAVGIFGAKAERSVRWDDDSHWGEGLFFLSGFEKGAVFYDNPQYPKYVYSERIQDHRPFSLLLYEVRAGHPEEWKYGMVYDPYANPAEPEPFDMKFFCIENEDQMREHGIDGCGPVDFSTKTVLIAYCAYLRDAFPILADWLVKEEEGRCSMTLFLIYLQGSKPISTVLGKYEYDQFLSSRIAVVVDKVDADACKEEVLRCSVSRAQWVDNSNYNYITDVVLPQMGVVFEKP